MTWDQNDRAVLGTLADVLIPAAPDRLSATGAGVATQGLDRVLEARPDLDGALRKIVDAARECDPHAWIDDVRANNPDMFGVLAEVVAGAYFMNSDVRQAIGYGGQTAVAIDPRPDYMEDGLLESVIRRGPIYRPTS